MSREMMWETVFNYINVITIGGDGTVGVAIFSLG